MTSSSQPPRQQLSLTMPSEPAYEVTDFMVSDCNRLAFDRIWAWPEWEAPTLLIYGPAASGKTHLAHIWAARSHAGFIQASDLTAAEVETLIAEQKLGQCWVVENVQHSPEEAALFHLLNAVREQKGYVLFTSDAPASQLPFTLPDLCSRMAALPVQPLYSPDETVLTTVLIKQFSDRQLRVGEEVIAYLVARIDRSYAAAREWVERIDAAAWESRRKISIPLMRQLLEEQESK
ncbi:MAG: HdaA/DnaA family protein [Rickettsiales bacterium]